MKARRSFAPMALTGSYESAAELCTRRAGSIRVEASWVVLAWTFLAVGAAAAAGETEAKPEGPARTIVVPAGSERSYDNWHYAPAVRVGDTVIASGIPAGGAETYEGKIRNMFERTRKVLAAAGAEMADVVEIQTFHREARDTETFQKEFAEFLKVHQEFFPANYPAWTAVGTTALLAPNAPVEMRVMAVIGSGKRTQVERAQAKP